MRKLFISFFIFFSLFSLGAQNLQQKFAIIGVQVQPSQINTRTLKITVFFNDVIGTGNLSENKIFLNDKPLKHTKVMFSKRGKSFSFNIPDNGEIFSLRFENINNKNGQTINSTRLTDFERNTFWKYSREKNIWQKS